MGDERNCGENCRMVRGVAGRYQEMLEQAGTVNCRKDTKVTIMT